MLSGLQSIPGNWTDTWQRINIPKKMAPPFSTFILDRTAFMGVYMKLPLVFSFYAGVSQQESFLVFEKYQYKCFYYIDSNYLLSQ